MKADSLCHVENLTKTNQVFVSLLHSITSTSTIKQSRKTRMSTIQDNICESTTMTKKVVTAAALSNHGAYSSGALVESTFSVDHNMNNTQEFISKGFLRGEEREYLG